MTAGNDHQPYDFSDWELGEDALSAVDLAVYNLIEEVRADRVVDPERLSFEQIYDAVTQVVRNNLKNAFDFLRSGGWSRTEHYERDEQTTDPRDNAVFYWVSEQDLMGRGHEIRICPEDLTRIFMADVLGPKEGTERSWEERWEAGFQALRIWRHATLTATRGMNAIKEDRRQRAWGDDHGNEMPERS